MTAAVSRAQYGCLVVNAPTANTVAAAEHGIAMLCALSRNVAQACPRLFLPLDTRKTDDFTGQSMLPCQHSEATCKDFMVTRIRRPSHAVAVEAVAELWSFSCRRMRQ